MKYKTWNKHILIYIKTKRKIPELSVRSQGADKKYQENIELSVNIDMIWLCFFIPEDCYYFLLL